MAGMREVLFIGAADEPVTGGEIYDDKVIGGLRRDRRVDTVTPNGIPPEARGYVASNLWLLRLHRRRFRHLVIVAGHFWHPRTFLFLWAARLGGARAIVLVHHLYHRLRPVAWQRVVDWVLEAIELHAAHHVVVNSRSTADDVTGMGIPRKRISVVHPAVGEIPAEVKRRPFGAGRPIRLLAVGYVGTRKGYEHLLVALAKARSQFRLTIVGDAQYESAYRTRLERLIAFHGLSQRVEFAGLVTDAELALTYRSADIFVAPTLWEGYGMALLDAMLYGLPIVATRVGAIPELVQDEHTGLLVPPRDADALAASLERLAGDPPAALEMGKRARLRALELAKPWQHVQDEVRAIVQALDR